MNEEVKKYIQELNERSKEIFEWSNPEDLFRVCMKQDKEINRLNNIINELEKWLEEQLMYFNENNAQGGFSTNVEDLEIVKDKLQELKGSDKEWN